MFKTFALVAYLALSPADGAPVESFEIDTGLDLADCALALESPGALTIPLADGAAIIAAPGSYSLACEGEPV